MDLSIIIPAYNEEARIGKTLEAYASYFKNKNAEIIVVIEGSDGTLDIVKRYSKKYPVRYLYSEKRLGKGGAILEGFKLSNAEYVGFVDADSAIRPKEFEQIRKGCEGYDGAIASRWTFGSERINLSRQRAVLSRGFNLGVKLYLGLPYTDTQCGAKIFSRKVAKSITSDVKVFDFAFDAVLLYVIKKKGFKINEVPITWRADEEGSTLRIPQDIINMTWSVIRSRFLK